MALRILRPGPFSTIQDLGRRGYMKDGFPQSGVMDDYSFLQANRLLGNDKNAAAIEMTLVGLAAAFTEDTDFVAAGGDFGAALDDIPIAPNMLYHAKAGTVITFGAAKTGCRCYLAVAGGFDVPPVMGSRSTNAALAVWTAESCKPVTCCPSEKPAVRRHLSAHSLTIPCPMVRLRYAPCPDHRMICLQKRICGCSFLKSIPLRRNPTGWACALPVIRR